jgi:hypothetical protein
MSVGDGGSDVSDDDFEEFSSYTEKGRVWVELPGLPWSFSADVMEVDGRPAVVGIALRPVGHDGDALRRAEVTAERLRTLPLVALKRIAIQGAQKGARGALAAAMQHHGQPTAGRGVPLPDDHYEAVAEVYRAAVAAGEHPRKAVMLTWDVSRATATIWNREARRRGLLPPA